MRWTSSITVIGPISSMGHLSPRWGLHWSGHIFLDTFRPAGTAHFDVFTLFHQSIILSKTHNILQMPAISVRNQEKLSKL